MAANILLAEDDRALSALILDFFHAAGLEVLPGFDGEQALAAAAEQSCDLLILDDLGSELTTQFVQSALYELLNTRLVANRHTVISSNLTMEEAARRYSPQIASRLIGEYHVLHFFGDDIRLLKKNKL